MNSVLIENSKDKYNLFLAILQHAPYGIIVCDEQGEITFSNRLATFLLQRNNLTKSNLLCILAAVPNLKKAWEILVTGDRNNIAIPFSIDQNTHSHDVLNLSLQATILKDTPDKKNYVLVFIEDLSIIETLDAADQHYTDSLEYLVDEKSKELAFVQKQLILSEKKAAMIETAGAVAHELRQPMTTIIGTIELLNLNDTIGDSPRLNKQLKTIRKQCLKMAGIIKQMEQLVEYKTRPYINGSLIIDLEESSQSK